MDDYYSSRRQEEGEWQLVVKGRNKSLKENSKGSNTNVVHGNNQRAIIKGHSNQDIRKNRSNATSFFITNFPKDVTAAMLWNRCKELGRVVDVYNQHEKYDHEKNMSSSSSEEEYEDKILPMDIQIEIMKRLPIKSLLKFMSVSKQWKSIIQSSRFIADYNGRRHIQPPRHFFVAYCNEYYVGYAYEYYVDIFNDDTCFLQRLVLPMSAALRRYYYSNSLIGYSQGLFGFFFHYHNYKDNVVIWNPSIRKSVFIPVPEHRRHGNYGFTVVCNATEPSIFGITYKPWLQVDIYTLSTGVWRTFSNTLDRESIKFTWKRPVVIDRCIHWIAFDCTPEGHRLNNLIVSCDIISEQFTELSLPPSLAAHTSPLDLHLYELRESLVVVEEDEHQQEIGVWMMMMELGVQNSFRKLYTVKLPYTSNFLSATVLGFRKDGQPILQIMYVLPCKRKLLSYEPDLERFNDIHISGNKYSCLADSYTETLLLLDH